MMRDLYEEAKRVFVWFDDASDTEEEALNYMPAVKESLKKAKAEDHNVDSDQPQTLDDIGLPEPSHPV